MGFNLSSITRGVITPPRIIIYSPHGVGKTTFLSEAPSPILLPTEDGQGKLDVASFPIARTYADVCEAIGTLLTEPHEYATFGLDSLDWLEPIIWAETCKRGGWSDIEQPGFGKGYTAAADVWREFFQGLVALREQRSMQVILTAHCEIKTFNDPNNDSYDRYGIKLQKRASEIAQEWADVVLFANYKSYVQKSSQAKGSLKAVVARGVGLGERVLYTEERPSFLAKNRYSMPPEIPMTKGASYAAVAAHIFPTAN